MIAAVKLNIVMALLALVIVMVAASLIDLVRREIETSRPAIEWHGVRVLTETVRPGGTLEMIYSATVHRTCPADVRGFLVAEDGSAPVRFPTLSGGYSLPSDGPTDIRVAVRIPPAADPGLKPLETGRHVYRTVATRYCSQGVEQDTAIPDAPFMLLVTP
jgi:hypothetical protein